MLCGVGVQNLSPVLQSLGEDYKHHCAAILTTLQHDDFAATEELTLAFWRDVDPKLIPLLDTAEGIDLFRSIDESAYGQMVDILIPDVLRSMSGALLKQIRQFIKQLEATYRSCLSQYSLKFQESKLASVVDFVQVAILSVFTLRSLISC